MAKASAARKKKRETIKALMRKSGLSSYAIIDGQTRLDRLASYASEDKS